MLEKIFSRTKIIVLWWTIQLCGSVAAFRNHFLSANTVLHLYAIPYNVSFFVRKMCFVTELQKFGTPF